MRSNGFLCSQASGGWWRPHRPLPGGYDVWPATLPHEINIGNVQKQVGEGQELRRVLRQTVGASGIFFNKLGATMINDDLT